MSIAVAEYKSSVSNPAANPAQQPYKKDWEFQDEGIRRKRMKEKKKKYLKYLNFKIPKFI